MRYLVYLRVSTDKQDVEMQRHHCMNYVARANTANAQMLLYVDPDVSTRIKMEKREALQKMLGEIRPGDIVITFKLDRLSRDIIEMVTIYRMIKAKKAQVYSLSEPGIEEWMLGIFASLAQKERENISQRTKAKMSELREKGVRLGRIPYGFKEGDDGSLELHVEEALVLQKMYTYRVKKRMPFRAIADALNKEGLRNRPTSKRQEIPWTYGAVGRVYTNLELATCLPKSRLETQEATSLQCISQP